VRRSKQRQIMTSIQYAAQRGERGAGNITHASRAAVLNVLSLENHLQILSLTTEN